MMQASSAMRAASWLRGGLRRPCQAAAAACCPLEACQLSTSCRAGAAGQRLNRPKCFSSRTQQGPGGGRQVRAERGSAGRAQATPGYPSHLQHQRRQQRRQRSLFYYATCHPGLEEVVAAELSCPAVGAVEVQPGKAGVSFRWVEDPCSVTLQPRPASLV